MHHAAEENSVNLMPVSIFHAGHLGSRTLSLFLRPSREAGVGQPAGDNNGAGVAEQGHGGDAPDSPPRMALVAT